jgi:hypothetical protein
VAGKGGSICTFQSRRPVAASTANSLEHHAIDDERVVPPDVVDGAGVVRPLQGQARDIRGVDLVERRVPAVADVEIVQRPVGVGAGPGGRLSARHAAERYRHDSYASNDPPGRHLHAVLHSRQSFGSVPLISTKIDRPGWLGSVITSACGPRPAYE